MTLAISGSSQELKELYKLAIAAREKSYSPYSGHKVGAAILTSDGKTYTGCNVENSSFGATVCAERVAVQKAVSENGKLTLKAVMVVTSATPPWPPCGMCRQVLAEFGEDFLVHTANPQGNLETYPFQELFPKGFTPSHMKT